MIESNAIGEMMPYKSIDQMQNALKEVIFLDRNDGKKAAGRALGTIVEIITFYLLKEWGFEYNICIEKSLPEYGNDDISHNVEFSLHPSKEIFQDSFQETELPFTSQKIIARLLRAENQYAFARYISNSLVNKQNVVRNSCNIAETDDDFINSYLTDLNNGTFSYSTHILKKQPFAIVECKRVGIEEGMRKGPQTIEKAKQGAYVARSVSSLQKVKTENGSIKGFIATNSNSNELDDYQTMLQNILNGDDMSLLRRFILTVGVVSNHGNWFTSENHNKEMKVLSHAYDWLLFLTDDAICFFVENFILQTQGDFTNIREAFLLSYSRKEGRKSGNIFTKVKMDYNSDQTLRKFFRNNRKLVDKWFNVISPNKDISELKSDLNKLRNKKWHE